MKARMVILGKPDINTPFNNVWEAININRQFQSLNTCNWDVNTVQNWPRQPIASPGTSTEPKGFVWPNNILSHITPNKDQVFKVWRCEYANKSEQAQTSSALKWTLSCGVNREEVTFLVMRADWPKHHAREVSATNRERSRFCHLLPVTPWNAA